MCFYCQSDVDTVLQPLMTQMTVLISWLLLYINECTLGLILLLLFAN